jgi:hypothetical protein
MRSFQSAIALLIAFAFTFAFAYVATPRASTELHAQVGVPCDCSWKGGSLGPVSKTCLGTGSFANISCTQVGSQCRISGTAAWTPATPNCLLAGPTTGRVIPIALATGATVFFRATAPQASMPWSITSSDCTGGTFGVAMDVQHRPWVPGSDCQCTTGTTSPTPIVAALWGCYSV